jgi:predicted GIY-YIG superfamily endonuclease
MASGKNGTLYVGVTSDLVKRAYEHRTGSGPGFAAKYGCKMLVYYELHADMTAAIGKSKSREDRAPASWR